MKKIIIVVVILAFVALASWRTVAVLKARQSDSQETEEASPTTVEFEIVKLGEITEELYLSGDIVADSEVTVFPKVAGKILKILVDEGKKVEKGKVIAMLEDKELKLQVKQASAAVEAARSGLDQAKSLSEVKVRSQVAQAQAAFTSAGAALRQVEDLAKTRVLSQMEQAEAGLAALRANLRKIKEGARDEEKRQIEATVQQAKANLDNAKGDLERIENLYGEGAISKQTLDATRTRAAVAEAQYEAAQEQLKLVKTGAREEDIIAVESQVKQAEAGLELVRSTIDTKSWEKDIEMAQGHYNQAKAALDTVKALEKAESWKAEIIMAETGVKQAETALELTQEMLNNATITAPIDGIVSKRFLDEGSMAAPATPLFTIVSMNIVKAIVNITEADLNRVSLQDDARVSVQALPKPKEGVITLISPTIDRFGRTASVEITIDNKLHDLKPGMFAQVSLPVDFHKDVVVVRRSAVIEEKGSGGKKHAFALEKGTAVKREVKTGIVRSDVVEILSGLRPGEKVIISGQHFLKGGEKVKATEAKVQP